MQLTNPISVRRVALPLMAMIAGFQLVRSGLGTFTVIDGSSMCPTFKPNDVVQTKTLHGESERGDVVIVTDHKHEQAIKRIIALPGETVTLYRGFVYIDSQRLSEPYLARLTYTFKSSQEDERIITWQLGTSQFFVMGDNRYESHDSRHYGPVARHQINRIVKLPENSPRPGFCELVLSETGKVMPGKVSHHKPARNRPVKNPQIFNARI